MKKRVAILGYGKLGQAINSEIANNMAFSNKFEVTHIWNRTFSNLSNTNDTSAVFCETIDDILKNIKNIDLVIECCHPDIVKRHAINILRECDLFISSPAAFADRPFEEELQSNLFHLSKQCYIGMGAALSINDIIRLDRNGSIKELRVTMRKAPSSIKIQDDVDALKRLEEAYLSEEDVCIYNGSIRKLCQITPQNTNVMATYSLAAATLGFDKCEATLLSNNSQKNHFIKVEILTKSGMSITTERDNPTSVGAVTGKGTFESFLISLLNLDGMPHNGYVFC